MLATTAALGVLDLAPHDAGNTIAVVFAPWVGSADAVTRAVSAGGSVIRVGRYPFIVVVHPQTDGYLLRVIREGAWAVLDPRALAGCASRKASLS